MRAQVDDHGPKRKWSFQAILSHSRPRLVPSFVSSFYRLDSVEVMMEKPTNLSPSRIEALPEGKHPDALVPGLCVIVSASGKRIWQFRRRVARSGKIVTLRLGGFPAHSIGAARECLRSREVPIIPAVRPDDLIARAILKAPARKMR